MKKVISVGLAMMIAASTMHAAAPNYRRVNLTCANPGSHQDVAKTPIITNSTRINISGTTKIYWEASDGDHGIIYGPLAPNESKSGLGNPGNGYSCTAYYLVKLF